MKGVVDSENNFSNRYSQKYDQVFKVTKSGQLYLQARDMQSFQIVFSNKTKMSKGSVYCRVPRLNGSFHQLDGEKFGGSAFNHFVVKNEMTGEVNCFSRENNVKLEQFSFFLFVSGLKKYENFKQKLLLGDGSQFFVHNDQKYNKTNSILNIKCIGGYYSDDPILRIDGENTSLPYDPLTGFTVYANQTYYQSQHFYECVKNNDVVSQTFGREVTTEHVQFKASLHETSYGRVFKCIARSNLTSSLPDIKVFVSCRSSEYCSEPPRYINSTNQLIFAYEIPNNFDVEMNYSCVFRTPENNIYVRSLNIKPLPCKKWGLVLIFFVSLMFTTGVIMYRKCKRHAGVSDLQLRVVSSSSLILKETIGSGNTSIIYKSILPEDETKHVAVKQSTNLNLIANEFQIVSKLNHPNIIKPIAITESPKKSFINKREIDGLVLPYFERCSLDKYLLLYSPLSGYHADYSANHVFTNCEDSKDEITTFDLVGFAWQLSTALVYLKQKNCLHRDLALRNILITDSGIIQLIDFERSRFGETLLQSKLRKITWQMWQNFFGKEIPFKTYSLEALKGNYTFSCEVWAFGIVLLEIFSFGKDAFPGIFNPTSYKSHLESMNKFEKPVHCPQEIFDEVITKCLFNDINLRQNIETSEVILRNHLMTLSPEKFQELNDELNNNAKTTSGLHRVSKATNGVHYATRNQEIDSLLA